MILRTAAFMSGSVIESGSMPENRSLRFDFLRARRIASIRTETTYAPPPTAPTIGFASAIATVAAPATTPSPTGLTSARPTCGSDESATYDPAAHPAPHLTQHTR